MKKPYLEDKTLYLEKAYSFGDKVKFGEVTARELGEMPIDVAKPKDLYPVMCMLTGLTPKELNQLSKNDAIAAIGAAAGFLGE